MAREYQARKAKPFILPETVYRQALWAVKDVNRMKDELAKLSDDIDTLHRPGIVRECASRGYYSDSTANKAQKMVMIENRLDAIDNALLQIPEKYRIGIQRKLCDGEKYGEQFHLNTWKRWQQVFIYHVAKNLGIF